MTLALMSVVLALVGPAIVLRPATPKEAIAQVIADSRRLAARRGQALRLHMTAAGEWSLAADVDADNPTLIRKGKISGPAHTLSLRISPLGICLPDASGIEAGFDPLTCDTNAGMRK